MTDPTGEALQTAVQPKTRKPRSHVTISDKVAKLRASSEKKLARAQAALEGAKANLARHEAALAEAQAGAADLGKAISG